MAISAAKLEEAMVGLSEAWRGSEGSGGWEDVRVLESVCVMRRNPVWEADCEVYSTERNIYASFEPSKLNLKP